METPTEKDTLRLVEPDERYARAMAEYVEEFRAAGETFWQGDRDRIGDDFAGYVRERRQRSRGRDVPAGLVPDTHYWLVGGELILGTVRLRHRLTDRLRVVGGHIGYEVRPSERRRGLATRMLAMALQKARQRGIRRAMVTCDKHNVASAKVIRSNGGRLASEGPAPPDGEIVQRYWIDLDARGRDSQGAPE